VFLKTVPSSITSSIILTSNQIKEYVGNHLARYKIPKYVKFLKEYPLTASGKVQK